MKIRVHFIKIFALFAWYAAAFVALLALGFHLWFVNHSEKAIEDLITWRSGGKLKAIMKNFKIDYLHNQISIKDLIIVNTDSSQQSTAYRFNTQDFHVRIRSLWDLFVYKELLVDSVVFNAPEFIVVRNGAQQQDTTKNKLQLTDELGNIYKAINQSLSVLNLQRFEINEGKVVIKDADNSKPPFLLSHIFFFIDKLTVDSNSAKNPSSFNLPERVFLHIANQKILLQDNKSFIAFKDLIIDSKEKLVKIASPQINIAPARNQQDNLGFTATELNISGLDFSALYLQQSIKADSIFIQNPKANIEIFANGKNKNANRKSTIEDFYALKQLPVTVNLNHIVIQHSDAVIILHKADKTTSLQTKNDNLSITGLHLNDTTTNILSIDGFDYTLRNYIGFTPDSIYNFRFDSLQFINNKIVLHHFTVTTNKKIQTGLIRDYTAPRFEITGLDWFSFIFNNHFKATSAVLYNPVLNLVKNDLPQNKPIEQTANKKSIYQLLSVLDNIVDLDELKIVDAQLNINQPNNLDVQLQNLNLDINTKSLTAAKSIGQIVRSVQQLSFDSAIATTPDAILVINKAHFDNGDKSLLLNNVLLNSTSINANLTGVALNDFSFDNNSLEVNGVQWKNGNIYIIDINKTAVKTSMQKKAPALIVNNIEGNNTIVHFENDKINADINLKTLAAQSLSKPVNDPFQIAGLLMEGNNASVYFHDEKIYIDRFLIKDEAQSDVHHLLYEKKTNNDSVLIIAPSFSFIPFINQSISTKIFTFDSVNFFRPAIVVSSQKSGSNVLKKSIAFPLINVKNLTVIDGSIDYNYKALENNLTASCEKLSLKIKDISTKQSQSVLLNNILFYTTNILIKKNDSISFKSKANLFGEAGKFLFDDKTNTWQLQLDKINADSVNYIVTRSANKSILLDFHDINATNINVNNADTKKLLPWFINQSNANVTIGEINWRSNNTNLEINHFEFDQSKKQISINSFSIDPGKSRETFINQLIHREDYMQAASGAIMMEGIEMNEGLLHIPGININNAILNIYSDKLKPTGKPEIQPLPVTALKKLPLIVKMDTIQLQNMTVHYTELNAETRQTGNVYFTNINGNIRNISSKAIPDSLSVNVSAKLLDTFQLHLIMNESYTNSLGSLQLQLQLGHGDLRLLNPFLSPLVSAHIHSGYLDSMNMKAFGNEYFSHGNMRLYYHNLNASLLDSGNVQHQKAGTKLLSFFANAIAIKKNNSGGQSNFNFVRNKQKSVIGYFLTMIVQGAAKSVAPVSSILYRKEYKKEVKKIQIPNTQ